MSKILDVLQRKSFSYYFFFLVFLFKSNSLDYFFSYWVDCHVVLQHLIRHFIISFFLELRAKTVFANTLIHHQQHNGALSFLIPHISFWTPVNIFISLWEQTSPSGKNQKPLQTSFISACFIFELLAFKPHTVWEKQDLSFGQILFYIDIDKFLRSIYLLFPPTVVSDGNA